MNTLRGYGQMTIGGALRPFHVGTNQTAIFTDLPTQKLDLVQYWEVFTSLMPSTGQKGEVLPPKRRHLSPSENRDFLYSALAAGAINDRLLPVNFTPEDVGNWMDDDDESAEELAKPLLMHLELMRQRIEKQVARERGNAPAPQLQASPGGKAKPKAKAKK